MNKTLLFRLFVLAAAMMCALGTNAAEAYACYTTSNTTLTFYYDNYRSSRTGTTYDLNTGSNDAGWDTDGTKSNVTKVVFSPSFADARPTTTYDWFYDMQNLHTIQGIEYLNTSEVTNMAYMFFFCKELTNIDLTHFVTSKVVNMRSMFSRCSGLVILNLGHFDTSKVTNMYNMFYDCSNLQIIYVGGGWSTAAVTNSEEMFWHCYNLMGGQYTTYDENHVDKAYAHIDGGPSDPGYFVDMGHEAYACYTPSNTTLTFYYDNSRSSRSGTTYDLNTGSNDAGWDTDGTRTDVTRVVFDPSFAGARPTTTFGWFYMMNNLESITGLSYLNTSEVTNMGHMFNSCYKLTSFDLSGFNTSKVTAMNCMFYDCRNLQTIYVGTGWSTAAVTNSDNMFYKCSSLVGGQGTTYSSSHVDAAYAHIDGGSSNPGYLTAKTEAYAWYTPSNTTLTFCYDNKRGSRTGTTYDLNTGNEIPLWFTDGICENVTQVAFNASFADARPTTTHHWFWPMRNLESITGLKFLNTSEVTDMSYMFSNCESLTSLDLSTFNTSKVTSMAVMFWGCTNLTSLDLSSFNTSNVTSMQSMFGHSNNLTILDLSGFDTHNVTVMYEMFSDCWQLKTLDLRGFNTSKVTSMRAMFYGCTDLETIYARNDWNTAAVGNSVDMFFNCVRLVGGQGTTYNNSHTDKTYARIDGGPSNPGYFTEWKEAYACYTPSNKTLTFYFDKLRSSRTGTTYDLNWGTKSTGWYLDGTNQNVTKAVFDSSFAAALPTTTYGWFFGMQNLQTIQGIEYLNTSEVTNMIGMFGYCSSLTSLDLSSFNTSKVTNMDVMFGDDINLRTIYVGDGWSTEAVTHSSFMFSNCISLVGGQGTTWSDYNPTDKTYARIDGGPSTPGYFTDKNAVRRGDVNGDGEVDVADIAQLIEVALGQQVEGFIAAAANLDDDPSTIDVGDVSVLINIVLGKVD